MDIDQIYHMDALELISKIDDESIDLILTDPPYNVSKPQKINRSGGKFGKAKSIELDMGKWDHGQIEWRDYIDDFVRILKPNGVIAMFYDKLHLGSILLYLRDKYGFQPRHIGTWVKSNPAPQARKVKWQDGTEMFLLATKNTGSGHHYNYKLGQCPDYFRHSVSFKPRYHPTQKPVPLFEWIIKYWSFEEDVVFDPFVGSGTTAIAAKRNNRHYICGDDNEEYVKIARMQTDMML